MLACPLFQSRAVGVAQGEDEYPLSKMGSPDVGGRNLDGARSVTESVQVEPHLTQPPSLAACDVLDDDALGPEVLDDVAEDEPQTGALSGEPGAFAGAADVLAWEAAADDPRSEKSASCDEPYIGDTPLNKGPVLREHRATEGILLNLPDDGPKAGALKTELQPADS